MPRDLTKTTVTGTLHAVILGRRIELVQTRKGKRGALYVCFKVMPAYAYAKVPDAHPVDLLVAAHDKGWMFWRDGRDMRLPQLSYWTKTVGELLTEKHIDQEIAEKVLDFLYDCINTRINP
jgi:hypothetical protein